MIRAQDVTASNVRTASFPPALYTWAFSYFLVGQTLIMFVQNHICSPTKQMRTLQSTVILLVFFTVEVLPIPIHTLSIFPRRKFVLALIWQLASSSVMYRPIYWLSKQNLESFSTAVLLRWTLASELSSERKYLGTGQSQISFGFKITKGFYMLNWFSVGCPRKIDESNLNALTNEKASSWSYDHKVNYT